jgi:hypothetical protein
MRKGIIALYDITGIQNYVYGSNKLKDNIGASNLVEKCFDCFFVNSIKKFYKEENFRTNWDQDTEWKYEDDQNLVGEIVYIGGGNALVVFENVEVWKKVNYEFSKMLMIQAPGLKCVTEYEELESNFSEVLDKLFKKMSLKKYCYTPPIFTKGLCITKECSITKNPAVINQDGFLSYEIYMKRENAKSFEGEIDIIDDLAGEKGDRYIGVVHIDGNNMGKNIEKITKETLQSCNDYRQAIKAIREFSILIKESYEKAYENMKKAFECIIEKSEEYKRLFLNKIPFRKILIKGDDVTYICYGKLAISSVEIFFKELNKIFKENEMTKNLNACAGIAFVKPHYPFSSAYEISEECCNSAKAKAKAINGNEAGFYLDFHILRGGMVENLSETRNKIYNVSYLEHKDEKDFEYYNLLWRPFEILGDKDEKYDFESIKKLVEDLRNIPRSKLKDLREAFLFGQEEIEENILMMNRRGYNLKFKDEEDIFIDGQSPYFDAIDFMELHDDLF